MNSYKEYFTVAYRNGQRVVILNENARPTQLKLENKKARRSNPGAFEKNINDMINRAIEHDTRIRLTKWF